VCTPHWRPWGIPLRRCGLLSNYFDHLFSLQIFFGVLILISSLSVLFNGCYCFTFICLCLFQLSECWCHTVMFLYACNSSSCIQPVLHLLTVLVLWQSRLYVCFYGNHVLRLLYYLFYCIISLWPPCIADADIIFSSCGFFFFHLFSSLNLIYR